MGSGEIDARSLPIYHDRDEESGRVPGRTEQNLTRRAYFTPRITNVLKGIALVIMFIHHFFTFPNWYVEGISYPSLEKFAAYFCAPSQTCVSVFAFLSGYFYFFTPRKDIQYGLRKGTDLFVNYWMVYLPMLAGLLAVGWHSWNLRDALLEFFALVHPIMSFCWYVPFYCAAILLLPFVVRLLPKGGVAAFLVGIVVPHLLFVFIQHLTTSDILYQVASDLSVWFPVVMSGYLVAKYRLFETSFDQVWRRSRSSGGGWAVWLLLAASAFMGRFFWPNFTMGYVLFRWELIPVTISMDIVYAPCFVYALVNLTRAAGRLPVVPVLQRMLAEVGKKSLLMWFLHCIFFDQAAPVLQPLLYLPRIPVLVVLWGLLLCYLPARLLDGTARLLIQKKNDLFFQVGARERPRRGMAENTL